uniref:Small integral membrane protein 4 n=1 Tax=Equus caballus TaxID=9796 RepID=A0A9L0TBA9_HORSE
MFSRAQVRRVLQWVPGKQRLGVYRFLPFFFVLGGTMEWIMIKVRVGQETFCKWGCSSLRFISGRHEAARDPFSWRIFLGCRPFVPPRAMSCFYPGQKGQSPWHQGPAL